MKKVAVKSLQNLQENIFDAVSFLIKLQAWGLGLFSEKDPGLGVFLWFFQNFKNTFLQNSLKKSIEEHFNRPKILLLYFYDAYDINLWEKTFGRSIAYLCRTNVFIKFHHLTKKQQQTQLKTEQLKQNIFKSMGNYGFS